MKRLIFISVIIGVLASVYNITHINYQIQRRTLAEMTTARAMVHWKWEHGVLGNPMQYRALVEILTSKFSPKMYIRTNNGQILETNYSHYVVGTMRFITITAMFVLLGFYYRKLGFNENKVIFGLFTFFALYIIAVSNESISLNTYIDLCFFLFASLIILYKKSWLWLLVFMPVAALNRETSVFVPAIMMTLIFFNREYAIEYLKPVALMIVWGIVFFGIREYFPPQTFHNFSANGVMGWSLIKGNLSDINSMALWLIFPMSAIYLYFTKRNFLHPYLSYGLALPILAMTAISFYGGNLQELRVFIIPICIFLIPLFMTEKIK
jgi:hypothetical protein